MYSTLYSLGATPDQFTTTNAPQHHSEWQTEFARAATTTTPINSPNPTHATSLNARQKYGRRGS